MNVELRWMLRWDKYWVERKVESQKNTCRPKVLIVWWFSKNWWRKSFEHHYLKQKFAHASGEMLLSHNQDLPRKMQQADAGMAQLIKKQLKIDPFCNWCFHHSKRLEESHKNRHQFTSHLCKFVSKLKNILFWMNGEWRRMEESEAIGRKTRRRSTKNTSVGIPFGNSI